MSTMQTSGRGISGLVPWFGGKRAMAPMIVNQICWRDGKVWKPSFFAEPFCGSMAVSLAMPEIPTHIVNDLHRDLINLACVLASSRGIDLVARAENTLSARIVHDRTLAAVESVRQELEPAALGDVSDEHFEWAYGYLVSAWLGKGGVAGTDDTATKAFASRFGPGGGSPSKRWDTVVRSLPGLIQRIRMFVIEHRDAFALLPKIHDKPGCAIYCDSPYLMTTRVSGGYRHDFSDAGGATMFGVADDHERLADALNRFEHTRIVVSYEDHPRLGELYPDSRWNKIEIDRPKNLANTNGGKDRVTEVLLVNGDVRVE